MKRIILISFCLLSYLIAFPQIQTNCENKLDTAQIIKIAKRHNAYWTLNWYRPPAIQYDSQQCIWTVVSSKSKHTNRGNCKNTNGCTLVKTVTLEIDGKKKKAISRKQKKKCYPNYE